MGSHIGTGDKDQVEFSDFWGEKVWVLFDGLLPFPGQWRPPGNYFLDGGVGERRSYREEEGFAEGLGLLPFWLPQTCFSPGSDSEAGLIPGTSVPPPEVMLCLCSEL